MQTSFLSYYVTQCFQHIYLATSTLWGAEGQSIFGTDVVQFTRGTSFFRYYNGMSVDTFLGVHHNFFFFYSCRHFISSDRWDNLTLAANDSRIPATILDALTSWLNFNGSHTIAYTDTCQGD